MISINIKAYSLSSVHVNRGQQTLHIVAIVDGFLASIMRLFGIKHETSIRCDTTGVTFERLALGYLRRAYLPWHNINSVVLSRVRNPWFLAAAISCLCGAFRYLYRDYMEAGDSSSLNKIIAAVLFVAAIILLICYLLIQSGQIGFESGSTREHLKYKCPQAMNQKMQEAFRLMYALCRRSHLSAHALANVIDPRQSHDESDDGTGEYDFDGVEDALNGLADEDAQHVPSPSDHQTQQTQMNPEFTYVVDPLVDTLRNPAGVETPSVADSILPHDKVITTCTNCHARMRIAKSALMRTIKCPKCLRLFFAEKAG